MDEWEHLAPHGYNRVGNSIYRSIVALIFSYCDRKYPIEPNSSIQS